jgi:hypothetical protein
MDICAGRCRNINGLGVYFLWSALTYTHRCVFFILILGY